LADKLIEKEVIFREDLEEIFGKRAWEPEVTVTSKKEEILVKLHEVDDEECVTLKKV